MDGSQDLDNGGPGIKAILEFKDKAERGACSAVETLVTVLIWDVLAASLLPGASINKIRI